VKSSLCVVNGSRVVSFKILDLIFVTASLWLILATASTSAHAQSAEDVSKSATTNTSSSPGDWTQFVRDNMERWNPYETVLGVGSVGDLGLKWTRSSSSSSAYYSDPVVANGVVYVGSGGDSHLYAIDAVTGENLWSFFAAGFIVQGTPAVVNGVIYFGADTEGVCGGNGTPCGALFAVSASTGAELWRYISQGSSVTDITVADGVVCFGVEQNLLQGSVNALDASTGAVLWKAWTRSFHRLPQWRMGRFTSVMAAASLQWLSAAAYFGIMSSRKRQVRLSSVLPQWPKAWFTSARRMATSTR